jgi:hypothetical protein
MKINFCSAPPGSGKTHEISNRSCNLAEGFNKMLILQPTRNLAEKTAAEEIHPFPRRIFHKGTVEGSVAKALADYVAEVPDDVQEVVLATHQVLPYIRNFANKDKWHVLIDEELQVVRYDKHEIPQTHDLITKYLAVRSVNSIYGRVDVIDRDAVEEIAKNEDDDEILETLAGICRILLNRYWESYVNIEQYEALLRGEGGILAFHSILKPHVLDGFASVSMFSANFEDTQVFKVWGQLGVEFVPDLEFGKKLRYTKHPNGDLVTIYYVTDHQWSRRRKETVLNEDGETILDRMVKASSELFTSGRFLWHANKAVIESPFEYPAQRLPNKPHGLNVFADFDDIVFLSSLNPTTDHFRFLKEQYEIGGDEVRTFTYLSNAYQAVMRSSIRDPESRTPNRILVPDLALAEYLQEMLPGSKVEKLDIGISDDAPKKCGRRRKHKSNRERVAQQRQRAREEKLRLLAAQWRLNSPDTYEDDWEKENENEEGRLCAENTIRLYSEIGTQPLSATIFSNKYSSIPLAYVSGEINAFVEFLHVCHEHQAKQDDLYLFSSAIFDPNRSTEKYRGKENILHLRHVVLDFEGGELRPETLSKLFPDLQMVVINTFNHTSDKPRFRAVLFTDESMTAEAYGLIYNSIADKLEEAGYSVERRQKPKRLKRIELSSLRLGLVKELPHKSLLFPLPSTMRRRQLFY